MNQAAEKYAGIHKAGMTALKSGNIIPYPGIDDPEEMAKLKNEAITVALFTEESTKVFDKGIARYIRILEEEFGYKIIVANRDFRLHATIITGVPYSELPKDELASIVSELVGGTFKFDWAMANGANILMAASNIQERVISARSELAHTYQSGGISPRNYDNMLHCTASRIATDPTNYNLQLYAATAVFLKLKLSDRATGTNCGRSGNHQHLRTTHNAVSKRRKL